MITENVTLLEFVNKHFKHYDIISGREEYDSLEIRIKGGKTGRMIVKRTTPYELTHNKKHKKYQQINVCDSFKLEISSEFNKINDYLFIKPYILLWSSGR